MTTRSLIALLAGLLLASCSLFGPATTTTTSTVPTQQGAWTLDWHDEFDGSALDTTVWNADHGAGGWGNNESEYYQAENATVAGGLLTITAKQETAPDGVAPYTSARLQTAGKKTFTYGRFEMRAKLPYSQGLWPAFWLLGANCNTFNGLYLPSGTPGVSWPGSGEIDIMEMIGGLADHSGDYTTHGTLHYLNASNVNPAPTYLYRNAAKLSESFHTYAVEWTPTSFTWYFDDIAFGTKVVTADMTAFHQPFFLLLNLAVGGNWGGWTDGTTVMPQTYAIDYVRHYTKTYAAAGAGLPSVLHLTNKHVLDPAAGTVSGTQTQFLLGFDTGSASWTSPTLTGNYDAGAWTAAFITFPITTATKLQARVYRSNGGSEVLLGTATADVDTGNGTNHATALTFTGMPALTLAGESLRLELTKLSGPQLTLIANGNDFDSSLQLTSSGSGTVGATPAGTTWVNPVAVFTGPATLKVYSDTAYAGTFAGLVGPSAYGAAGTDTKLTAEAVAGNAQEGANSLKVHLTADGQGFSWAGSNNDLSGYTKLHFWLKTSSAATWIRVRVAATGPLGVYPLDTHVTADGAWHEVVVPVAQLSGLSANDLKGINTPFGIEAVGGTPDFAAQIDNIWYSGD